jgi:hypothetical protein
MSFKNISLILAAVLLGTGGELFASDRWETLQAINLVENPKNSLKPGSKGELGPYQFRESTWRMHTNKPFSMALERDHADEIAVIHYEWIRNGLERNGLVASPYNIALAWNAGLSAVINGRIGARTRGYAGQVVNLVEELNRNQVASLVGK